LTADGERQPVIGAGARRGAVPILVALVILCWGILWLWGAGPYGRYLEHGRWTDAGAVAALCRAVPAGNLVLPLALYAGGWLLMTAAMMLPTTLPLVRRFDRIVEQRPDRSWLVALLIGGYLAVWAGFGVAAHLVDAALHELARRSPWLTWNGWIVGSLILAVAGSFQFSGLKYRCLARCRAPYGFIARHWRGPRPYRNALSLGLDHGWFCFGCCWAIMLVLFVVGTGNLGWMLALGALMALEKNTRWGARISRPLGGALLAGATSIAAFHLAP
jgi:predicted metal-binding membrane protein